MSASLDTIDHAVVAVRDLDAASETYAKLLGRRPSWRGVHPGAGTANVLFRLDNTYLELLSPSGQGWLGDAIGARLKQQGEGPTAIAFGAADAAATATALRETGLGAGEPVDGEGRDLASGRQRRWRICMLPAAETRGLTLFAVQHLSPPESLPIAERMAEPPSVVGGVDHFVIMTANADASRELYGDKLGLRLALDRSFPERGVRLLFFRIGGLTLECAAALSAEGESSTPDRFWGISYRVADVARARERVASAGFDVSEIRSGQKPGTRVCTVRRETHGVATLFIGPE